MGNRTTIVDIAKAAGVSKSLVSLAIRNDPGVSATTRERILRIADELGYRSNIWARSLVRGKTGIVGVLLTDLSNPYHTDVVNGVEDAARDVGLSVLISHGRHAPELLSEQVRQFASLAVDGIVVISAHTPADALEDVAKLTPVVVVGRPASLPEGVSWIRNDDELGAQIATRHLLDRGRKRIGFLQNSGSVSAVSRRDSYVATMKAASLEPRVLIPDDVDRESLRELDGVVAANDRGAVWVLGEASDAGLRVPEDLAIVGYDNSQLSRIVRPQLSSVDQPRLAMGRRALEILRGGDVVREVFEPELVVRGSSGG